MAETRNVIHLNPDHPIRIEREAVNDNELDNRDTFELVKSYLDGKFKSMKRELSDSFVKQAKKSKSHHTSAFKYKSNEKQFEFNNEIIETLEGVMGDVDSRVKKKLKYLTFKLSDRNKLIKMADRSPAGWATVDEYLPNDLASDSEYENLPT